MLRAIILALVLSVAFGAIIPIATEYAEAGAKKELLRKKKKKNRAKVNRKYFTSNYTKRKKRLRKFRKSNRTTTAGNNGKSIKKYRRSRRYNAKKIVRKTNRVRKKSTAKRYTKKRRAGSSKKYANVKYRKAKYRKATYRKVRKKRSVRKYSANWMRSYHAKKSRQQKIIVRKRNMRLKRIRLAKQNQSIRVSTKNNYLSPVTTFQNPAQSFISQDDSARQMEQIQINQVQTFDNNGEVSLDIIGASVGETSLKGRNKTVGGISTTTLRRTVIDRMIQENGWVENDYQKEIGGKKVYVVVAKSEDKKNQIQSRTFYFTESNGQIYRVSAKAPNDSSEQLVKKTERVIETLEQPKDRPQQAQASNTQ